MNKRNNKQNYNIHIYIYIYIYIYILYKVYIYILILIYIYIYNIHTEFAQSVLPKKVGEKWGFQENMSLISF